jgi:NitT/TauT family transport system substrate-binding protein
MSSRANQSALLIAVAALAVIAIVLFRPPAGAPSGSASPTGGASATASSSTAASASAEELRPVRLLLGFQPDVQFAPFYLAQQAGYFRDAGLEVTIEYSDDVLRLVADGQAELGVADATDVMIGRTSGIPIKYVATLYEHFPVALIGSPDAVPDDPSGLAGMRIGTPGRFGSSWHALVALLDAGGLTPDDATIREYPQFNQVEGLLNGDVDLITGFLANEPLRLRAQGFETELLTVDHFAPLPGPGLVAGDDLLASDPDLVNAVASAVVQAQEEIGRDPQRGVDAAVAEVPAIGEDRATATAVLEATIDAWDPPVSGGVVRDVWDAGYQTLRRLGFIDGSVPVEDMYDLRVMGIVDPL